MSPFATVIHERVALARAGRNPTVIARMASGWAVLGDHQVLPGYSLLLADPVVGQLADLHGDARTAFLLDMAALGDAVLAVQRPARVNFEILGSTDPALHAHVWPRYATEPDEFRGGPVGRYPRPFRQSEAFSLAAHGPLLDALRTALHRCV